LKHHFPKLAVSSFAIISALFLGSCRENTLINAKLSPANNAIGVFGTTLSTVTRTFYNDSVQTSMNFDGTGIPVVQAVGKLADPFFGDMTAATFFQVTPSNFTDAVYPGGSGSIDSAVLVLPYSGYSYGDTTNVTQTQTYQVFYMTDSLTAGAPYYSYTTKPVDESNPLSAPFTANVYHLKDSLAVNGTNYAPGLRIPLNKDVLLSHLLPALAGLSSSSTPAATFNNAFKGVCVRPTSSGSIPSAIPYFRLNGTGPYGQAGIIVYYRTSSNVDTFQQYYYSTSVGSHFNSIVKTYSSAPVNTLYTQPIDSIAGVQNAPGATIDLKIGGIKLLPKGIINKAEIQLTVLPWYSSTLFTPPVRLDVSGIGNGTYPVGVAPGVSYNISDRYPLASATPYSIIDGYAHQFDRNGTSVTTYTINIPREVMASQAANNDTLHLHVTGTKDLFGIGHLVVGGGNHPNPIYSAKLFVVYSVIE
jgi:hypothetical protein